MHDHPYGTLYMTRFVGLHYAKITRQCWRYIATDDGLVSAVGPYYRTRTELLADLRDFAAGYGFNEGKTTP